MYLLVKTGESGICKDRPFKTKDVRHGGYGGVIIKCRQRFDIDNCKVEFTEFQIVSHPLQYYERFNGRGPPTKDELESLMVATVNALEEIPAHIKRNYKIHGIDDLVKATYAFTLRHFDYVPTSYTERFNSIMNVDSD